MAGALATGWLLAAPAHAKGGKPLKAKINLITADGIGVDAGTVTFKAVAGGVEVQTNLRGLPPGEHGFHLHEVPSCEPADKEGKKTAGQAAGGHFDPASTKAHKGPGGGGHKGDLPKLDVGQDGRAKASVKVDGLTLDDVQGRAVMIHAGGDNYADAPKPLGGGGERIACGVVPGGAVATPPAKP